MEQKFKYPSPWPTVNEHWRALFGQKVRRVPLDPGFSCPNRDGKAGTGGCIYCDETSFSPAAGDERPVDVQLAEGIKRARGGPDGLFAAYLQPRTNTYAPVPVLKNLFDVIAAEKRVVVLAIGTRPDEVPETVLDLIASYNRRFGETWLELGLQSAHEGTLAYLNRGHGLAHFDHAVREAKTRGIKVLAHAILGLPGESAEMELKTARHLAEKGIDGIKLHQLSVIGGTVLHEHWLEGRVRLLDQDEYATRAAAFIKSLPPGVILHRVVGDTLKNEAAGNKFDKTEVIRKITEEITLSKTSATV